MKTFNETIRAVLGEAKGYGVGEIYWDDPKFDLENPTVKIRGYGTMSVNFLEENIAKELQDLSKKVSAGSIDVVAKYFLLDEKSAFMYKVKALMDAKQMLSSGKVKRKLTMMKKKQADTYKKNIDYDTARFNAKTRKR
tara:strand:- start:1170 stop:1583 length:414 start_codon:yes stop_codon:yes gene_type:complete